MKIVGVAVNGILLRGDIEEALINVNQLKDERTKKIFRLLYDQNLKLNLFNRFNVDKIFEIRILSVDANSRGQGLAKELWRRSEVMAGECNFQVKVHFLSTVLALTFHFFFFKRIIS